MIVVSNTSPLTNLAAIGQFQLLQQVYQQLHIANGVWDELNARGLVWPGRNEVEASPWITRYPVENQILITALQQDLDRGEAETIALAIELGADLVLLDERAGREQAKRLGLNVTGVLGTLVEAKAKGILPTIRPTLDDLRRTANFFISNTLYERIMEQVEE